MGIPFSTDTGSTRVIARFGRFARATTPGCNVLVLPCCWETIAGTLSLRLQQLNVKCETKTKDNVFITIQTSIQYQVLPDRVEDAFYRLSDPKKQIEAYVFDVIRSEVPKVDLDNVFLLKEELSERVKAQLKAQMEKFGFEIISTPVTDIDHDIAVKNAMNEINKQERLKQASKESAEAKKILAVKDAEARAESTRIQARAESDAKYLSGQGLARQRQAIVEGLQESVKIFQEGVPDADSNTVMDLILLTQYFDTLKDIGSAPNSHTMFVNSQPGTIQDLVSQMRMGIVEGNLATSAALKNRAAASLEGPGRQRFIGTNEVPARQ